MFSLGCGGSGSGTASGPAPAPTPTPAPAANNPAPALTGINPVSAQLNAPALTVTVTGSNFLAASTVQWNGVALTTTYVSGTTLTALVPSSDLAKSGAIAVTVQSPAPGGGSSSSLNFIVEAVGTGTPMTVNVMANSLAWDNVNQRLYLSLPSADGSNGNSVQALDPVTGTLGVSGFAGSEPGLLAVSANSKYLYVGLNGASSVQRLLLPGLTTDISIPLGASTYDGPYYAGDLQAAPNADQTVAVVRDVNSVSPAEEGGVVIYDDGTARSSALCGFIQQGCNTNFGDLFDTIQWNADGSAMYSGNNEDTGFNFYSIPVTAAGFGTVKNYGGVLGGFGLKIHFDPTTGYVYTDGGGVIDPATGTTVGTFQASGVMVPDGKLGVAFFLGQDLSGYGSGTYTLESFDLKRFTKIGSVTIKNVNGFPAQLVRWGTNGLAFTTYTFPTGNSSSNSGNVYLISGSFVSGQAPAAAASLPQENVQRTWSLGEPLQRLAKPEDEVRGSAGK